jgi:signal transduction histidine kinase
MPDQPRSSARIVAEPRWDVYYAVVLAACLAIVDAAPVPVSQRIIATDAMAAMVPWYLFLGRPLMMQDQPATRKATVYLAGLVVLFAVAQSQVANAWVLAFGLVPMCFHVTSARRALAFVVMINVIGAGLDAWRNPGLAGALTALGIAAFAIAFAYVYSRWMARVIAQSLDRAALIEQLEATRAELAAAHHEAGVQAERHRLAGEIHDTLARGSPASSPCSRPARPASTQPAPPAGTSTWRCSPRARTWPRPGPWSPRSPRRRWRPARSATPCAGSPARPEPRPASRRTPR